ncbi:Heterokaryon incompatibility [Colletotrichum asianum]
MRKRFKAGDKSMTGRMRTRAQNALRLLESITNDLWWTRGWTFQENYRAGPKMKLLMPLSPNAEESKYLMDGLTSEIEGELSIPSVEFMEAVTIFCEEYQKIKYHQNEVEKRVIDNILSKAGKYTILLDTDAFMFPAIISDLSKRELGKPWDMLAILANCCQYPNYLDTQKLLRNGANRNLSILAMCLINGEILNNSWSGPNPVSGMNVFEYLEKLCLTSFAAPPGRDLTFRKGCRFHSVSLHEAGIRTEGYLWELGHLIDTSSWKPPRRADPMFKNERFSEEEIDQLAQLMNQFKCYWRRPLADGIKRLLRSGYIREDITFARSHMEAMAKEVARAVAEGQELRLGRLCTEHMKTTFFLAVAAQAALVFANCRVEILDGNSFQLGTACIPKGDQGPVAVNGRNYFVTATTSCGLGFLGTQTHPSDWQLKLLGNC